MQSGAHKKEAAGLEGSRGLVRSLVVRRDDQNRARCEPDHPLTGRAEHKVCERAMPAGSRDDEICVAFSCHFRDGLAALPTVDCMWISASSPAAFRSATCRRTLRWRRSSSR